MAPSHAKRPFETQAERATGLTVHVDGGTFVLPWCWFVFAIVSDEQIVATWTTHVITILGKKLDEMTAPFNEQKIVEMRRSARADSFDSTGVVIRHIAVALRADE